MPSAWRRWHLFCHWQCVLIWEICINTTCYLCCCLFFHNWLDCMLSSCQVWRNQQWIRSPLQWEQSPLGLFFTTQQFPVLRLTPWGSLLLPEENFFYILHCSWKEFKRQHSTLYTVCNFPSQSLLQSHYHGSVPINSIKDTQPCVLEGVGGGAAYRQALVSCVSPPFDTVVANSWSPHSWDVSLKSLVLFFAPWNSPDLTCSLWEQSWFCSSKCSTFLSAQVVTTIHSYFPNSLLTWIFLFFVCLVVFSSSHDALFLLLAMEWGESCRFVWSLLLQREFMVSEQSASREPGSAADWMDDANSPCFRQWISCEDRAGLLYYCMFYQGFYVTQIITAPW